jgi:hypothetical protein
VVFKLLESKDLSNHSSITCDFDVFKQHTIMGGGPSEDHPKPPRHQVDWPYDIFLPLSGHGIDFGDVGYLPWNALPGEPCHLPFSQLFDPVRLLVLSISNRDDKVRYPGVIIEDEPLRSFAGGKGNRASIDVQLSLEVKYLVSESEGGQRVLLLPSSNSGGEALGNVEDGGEVVLVELHHSFSGARGDGSCKSHRGPYDG